MKRKEEQCPKLERGAVTSNERRGWELAKRRGDHGYEHLHLALTLEERRGRREVPERKEVEGDGPRASAKLDPNPLWIQRAALPPYPTCRVTAKIFSCSLH